MATSDINPTYGAVLFCTECGSNRLDVNGWVDPGTAKIVCYGCYREYAVKGLTVGRADLQPAQVTKAMADRAEHVRPEFSAPKMLARMAERN